MAMQISSAELIRYGIVVEGQEKAQAAFKGVAAAQLQSQTAADKMSASLRAAARTAEVEARALERSAQTMKTAVLATSQASKVANDTMGSFTANAKGAALSLGAFTSAAAGSIPGIEGMGGAIARSAGVMQQMTVLLGAMGPEGAIIGAAVGGLGLLSSVVNDSREEWDRLTKSIEDANAASDKAFYERAQASASARTATAGAAAKRAADEAAYRATGGGIGLHGERFVSAEEEKAYQDALEKLMFGGSTRDKGGGGQRGPRGVNYGDPISAAEGSASGALEADLRYTRRLSDAIAAEEARGKASASRLDKFQAGLSNVRGMGAVGISKEDQRFLSGGANEEAQRVLRGEDANEKARTDRMAREWAKRDKLVTDHHDLLRDSAHSAWTMVGASAGAALAALASGQKVAAAAVLGALGQQLVASGTGHVFEGLFQSLMLNPLGPEMVAIGTAEAAFGASLAIAGGGAKRGAAGVGRSAGAGGGGFASPTYAPSSSADRGGERFELHIHSGEPPSQEYIMRTYRGFQQLARNGLIPQAAVAR